METEEVIWYELYAGGDVGEAYVRGEFGEVYVEGELQTVEAYAGEEDTPP